MSEALARPTTSNRINDEQMEGGSEDTLRALLLDGGKGKKYMSNNNQGLQLPGDVIADQANTTNKSTRTNGKNRHSRQTNWRQPNNLMGGWGSTPHTYPEGQWQRQTWSNN